MIFQRNESFKTYIRFYPVTSFILALNLIVFVIDYLFLDQEWTIKGMYYLEHVFNRYGLDEPWRYVTSIALHGGWDHILFNSFSILVFAPPLERLLGHFRYFVFYLLSGIAGNIMTTIIKAGSDYGSVGASGAIYGLFGAYLFLAVFRKFALDEATRKTIFFMLGFGLIYSIILPNINIWAHIGGAIAGFVMMSIYAASRRRRRNHA
ncbi:rhomboid family intramembrane serine protease [Cohnella terricola]|uniref:Rhomboid family intramembrane serine protease n=1 Tax=Cohnella terricola TaxID=1289167 RepID=A0A559JTT5_9BACL|nr:rhomboid family intramembrane serine protease [Cohnella terricola]TVY03296.1 rhomboid family intramembrane serine protease [Cohnella terricola]